MKGCASGVVASYQSWLVWNCYNLAAVLTVETYLSLVRAEMAEA